MDDGSQAVTAADTVSRRPVVFIVDDDEDVADTYALWLKDEYRVETAYGGAEALERITDEVDVVLLDRRMPNVPGDEVVEHVRENDIDCQVSMLTAVEPDSDLTDLDFDEYLVKPVTKSEVVDVVEELLIRDTLDEETQEYLSLKSTAEAIEKHTDDDVRDSEAIEELQTELESAAESPTIQEQSLEFERLTELNRLLRSINHTVVDADSTDELCRGVCRQFADISPYDYALIGEYTETYHEFLPTTASDDAAEFESITCDTADPVREAVEANEVRAVRAEAFIGTSLTHFADASSGQSFESAVIIPVGYRETVHGATILFSTGPAELNNKERSILREIGTTIGNAIDSLRTEELVHADSIVELELRVTDRNDVFVALSAEHGCRIELDGINFSSDEGVVCYVTVEQVPTETVLEFFVETDGVEGCRAIDERGDDVLVECTVSDAAVVSKLLEAECSVKTFSVEDGRGHVTVEMTPEVNLRSVLGSVRSAFEDVDFVSKRTTERSYESVEGFGASLGEKLTERQQAVIDTAYNAGYFDWPRESTAEEVAEGLGMAPPTLHEHLRESERKLVETYLEETK